MFIDSQFISLFMVCLEMLSHRHTLFHILTFKCSYLYLRYTLSLTFVSNTLFPLISVLNLQPNNPFLQIQSPQTLSQNLFVPLNFFFHFYSNCFLSHYKHVTNISVEIIQSYNYNLFPSLKIPFQKIHIHFLTLS